jgi:hypothetical protein
MHTLNEHFENPQKYEFATSLSDMVLDMVIGLIESQEKYEFIFQMLQDENHEAGCFYCINKNKFSEDQYEIENIVFDYFNNLGDFRINSISFRCNAGHLFVLETERD